jgi:FAD-dependent monooxygenase
LKPQIEKDPLIDSYFGLKFESLVESGDSVESTLIDTLTGETHTLKSDYVIGCDGAGSRVRGAIGGGLIGGPV